MLLGDGVDLTDPSPEDFMLYTAVKEGQSETVKNLIENGANIGLTILEKDSFSIKFSLLHKAAAVGNKETVEHLLNAGADPLAPAISANGQTPVHHAVRAGNLEIVRLFAERGVGIAMEENDMLSPLYFAASSGNLEMVNLILEYSQNPHPNCLEVAAERNHTPVIKRLLEHGITPNASFDCGNIISPLYYSVMHGNHEMIDLLLENKADPNLPGDLGANNLTAAVCSGDTELIKRFLDYGNEVNAVDHLGLTPIYAAVRRSNVEIVEYLIDKGADIHTARGMYKQVPLHCAIEGKCVEMVKKLIECKADVNVFDIEGHTPLNYAEHYKLPDVINILKKHGAR